VVGVYCGPMTAYPPLPATDQVYSSRDVAALFGVNMATVRRWAKSGRLAGFKHPGGHWRYTWDSLAALRNDEQREDG
jgi:predicted site-specific integrase-resolvase